MKAFLWSVLGAVVSAILIYFANGYLEKQFDTQKYSVEYKLDDTLFSLSKDQLVEIGNKAGKYSNNISVGRITIHNTGSEAISDQKATVRVGEVNELVGGVLKVENIQFPGEDPDGVKIETTKDRIDLTYKLLNPDEYHSFWFAYESFGSPSLTMRGEGLILQEAEEFQSGNVWGIGSLILLLIAILVAFLAGALVSYNGTGKELKARGEDLEELLKKPKLADGSTNNDPHD